MKKALQRTLSLFLVLVMAFAFVPNTTAFGEISNQPDEDFIAFHNVLVDEFGLEFANNYHVAIETANIIYDNFPRNRMGEIMYPDYFGGMYIDEFGVLNVLVTQSSAVHMRQFDAVGVLSEFDEMSVLTVGQMQATVVRGVEFTYAELWRIQNLLNEIIPPHFETNPVAANARSWFIDVIGNRVVVELADYTLENIRGFKSYFINESAIVFAEFSGEMNLNFDVYTFHSYETKNAFEAIFEPLNIIWVRAGEQIVLSNGSSGSVGYSATRLGGRGFVTAGHLGPGTTSLTDGVVVRNAFGQRIGVVRGVHLSLVDAAFVLFDANVRFAGHCHITQMPFAPGNQHQPHLTFPGIFVASIGFVTHHRTGVILQSATSINLPTAGFLPNVVRASYVSNNGDSGGIVYAFDGNQSTAIGHHVGNRQSDNSSFFVRSDITNQLLGTTSTWPDGP